MRSSVSVILSNPPPDTTMSYPDYTTTPHHHQTLLVMVRQVGTQLKSRTFNKLYERICRVNHVKVSDSSGGQRPVWVNYRREYPIENNDWGDFQTHRRVLGIITIGQVSCQNNLDDICKQHESLKVKYSATLYDSRCIILGLNPDGSVYVVDSQGPSRTETPEPGLGLSAVDGSVHSVTQVFSVPETIPFTSESLHLDSLPFTSESLSLTLDSLPSTHAKKASVGSNDRDSGVYENNGEDRGENSVIAPAFHVELPALPYQVNGLPEMTPHLEAAVGSGSDSGSESTSDTNDANRATVPNSVCTESSSGVAKPFLQPPSNFKTRALFYPTGEHAVNLESQLQEFLCSLFWVLESKRLDKSQEKLDKPPLLCAPFERKDFIGLDMDSRVNRKRCMGRLRKQLADLTLQAGLPAEAISHYTYAADVLRSCNDWLWLAACYEGLCSAAVVILYPQLRRSMSLQRFSSWGLGQNHPPHSSTGQLAPKTRHLVANNTSSLPPGLEPTVSKQLNKNGLNADELIEKYRDTIVHYSKYRNAGVIETETSIKAVHVLIEQRRYLMAAEFLSNVVFINLQLTDEEKITRFNALADLYHQIGFHRKASFFRRVAAMRCVAPQNQTPDWPQCYRLLLQTLPGYRVSLDPLEFRKDGLQGWPALQVQILQELVGTSRRMGNDPLCTRHQAFLLSAMLPHLSVSERREMALTLESLSARSPSAPTPLVVNETGVIIPPVNFLNLPVCRSVLLMELHTDRCAKKRSSKKLELQRAGPFIFSPFASLHANASRVPGKMEFDWVEGDICEVNLELENPMPFELKMTGMTLITEGVQFESWTSTVVLTSEPGLQAVTLRGRPLSSGELRVTGYASCVFGVTSNCRFKFMPQLKIPQYVVTVVPQLPFIQVLSCDNPAGDSICRPILNMNQGAGETREITVTLLNTSQQPLEKLEVNLDSRLDPVTLGRAFQFSQDNLKAQLPVMPGNKASFTLYIYGQGDFLCPGRLSDERLEATSLLGSEPASFSFVSPPSFASRQSFPSIGLHSGTPRGSSRGAHRADSTASALSSRSNSSLRSNSSSSSTHAPPSSVRTRTTPTLGGRTLECTLRFQYSGGCGLRDNYWRSADLTIAVEVTPSLLVTRWDVLPAETVSQCYLVLDLMNVTCHEMELRYTAHKRLLIEAWESCRVPVPIERCPLARLSQSDGTLDKNASAIVGEHVSSLVDLQWTLSPNDTPGRAFLHGISFPPAAHDLIAMAPIQWEVTVNGREFVIDEVTFRVGESISVVASVTNTSGGELPSMMLRMTPFQDYQNGQCCYRLEAKMTTSGATLISVPSLHDGESFSHSLGLVMFTGGNFKLDISCSPSAALTAQQSLAVVYENVQQPYTQAWKFVPPVEFCVVDL